jgi:hypothetical protein
MKVTYSMKPVAEYTGQERRELLAKLTASVLRGMHPNCTRYSGQQIAYAKGRAWQHMRYLGF